jgi:hypothetical protein
VVGINFYAVARRLSVIMVRLALLSPAAFGPTAAFAQNDVQIAPGMKVEGCRSPENSIARVDAAVRTLSGRTISRVQSDGSGVIEIRGLAPGSYLLDVDGASLVQAVKSGGGQARTPSGELDVLSRANSEMPGFIQLDSTCISPVARRTDLGTGRARPGIAVVYRRSRAAQGLSIPFDVPQPAYHEGSIDEVWARRLTITFD